MRRSWLTKSGRKAEGRALLGSSRKRMGLGVATVISSLMLSLFPAAAASAATVYEIRGAWEEGTPSTVGRGDVINAIWRVNVNDDAPAPGNEPVDNVTFTATTQNGVFKEVPNACLTADVDPVSAIDESGKALTCNLGTVNQGSAVVVQTPIRVDGNTGGEVIATGQINGQSKGLDPLLIENAFGMDLQFGQNTAYYEWNEDYTAVDVDLQWSLRLAAGSDTGPDSVTYRLQLSESNGSQIGLGDSYYGDFEGCSPYNAFITGTHPLSGLEGAAKETYRGQEASFVEECTLTPVAGQPGVFDLTLSGINYDMAMVPTRDAAGNLLPTDWSYIASGSLWFRVATERAGSISLQANAPAYQSTTGLSSVDLPENNTTSKAYVLPGVWAASWWRPYTGAGGNNWDDTYRVSAGTKVVQYINHNASLYDVPDATPQGQCLVFDADYVTYTPWAEGDALPTIRGYIDNGPSAQLKNPPAVEYYVGDVGDPDVFDCGSDPNNWTTTEPADLTTVEAMRIIYPHSLAEEEGYRGIQLAGYVRINDDVRVGQDIWMFGSVMSAGSWTRENVQLGATPDARYPRTNGRRDILRTVTATPAIRKSVDRSVVKPGEPANFTLTYSANGAGAIPETMDGYVITDTLPVGMTYVAGSTQLEPVVSTNDAGQQVLTWTLDDVPTNVPNILAYQAVAGDSASPGQVLTNTARSSVGGLTSTPASAQVTVSTSGATDLGKSTDQWFISNPDGDGSGEEGSWTVTLRSQDPLPQAFTDTIDILPYNGDNRGTDFAGTYDVTAVNAPSGATVYYTTAEPASLSDDPSHPSNGTAPGSVVGNTVDWSTTPVANPTAIRVIGGALAPGATFAFTVTIEPDGSEPGDVYVNRAQAIAEHTELVMRTSEPLTMGAAYSASLKKYVKDAEGNWADANDVTTYPTYRVGDEVPYRIVILNTGQGTLRDVEITDTLFPEGSFTVDELAPGAEDSHEFTAIMTGGGSVVNNACGAASAPADSEVIPTINCDPAGVEVVNYTTEKSSDPASGEAVKPGDTITYTVKVTQEGDAPAVAEFSDDLSKVLDDATYNGDVSASLGSATVTDGVLSWAGTVPVGEVATITYSVKVEDSAALAADGDYTVGNQVTSPGCESATSCATQHPVGDYTVVKSSDPADGSNVAEGDVIEYTVTATQVGEGAFSGASLVDDLSSVLDDATWNDDLKASDGTVTFDPATQELSWSGDLAVDAKVTVTYSVTVTGEGDTHLRNVVTSAGCASEEDCRTDHYTASYTTVKTSDPASGTEVQAGDVITYTVTVTQSGLGRVVGQFFNDDLANVLDDATFNDDIRASAGEFTHENGVIAWTGDLGPGDVATITYSVTVTAEGDTLIGNTVQSPGCESAQDCRTEHKTGRYETVKTSDPASGSDVQVGDTIDYTVTVTQVGEGAVKHASFIDDLTAVLDDATWQDGLKASTGTVSYAEPTISWSGDLAVGAKATITYSVTVTGDGDMALTNVVTSAGCVDAANCTTTHQTGDYTVSKTSNPVSGSDVAVADTITYTVTVAQRGPGAVAGASLTDDLSKVLDDASWNGDLAATAGEASFDADSAQLSWTGDLAVGASVTITYSVAVTGDGDMTLTNVVTPGEHGECVAAPDGNEGCSTSHQTGRFVFSKMADAVHNSDVQSGDVITYTVTVAQDGPAGVAASVTDDLSDVIDDATYNGDVTASAGTAAVEDATLSWSGDLAPGEVVTITYSVTVSGAGNTTLANVVSTTSPAGECVTAEDGTEDCRTVHKTGGYVFSKTADPNSGSTVHTGEKVTYTATVTQRGGGTVENAIVTDDLTEVLDDAAWNDDATSTSGVINRDGNLLTWTGDLAVGQTVTITYSVTVTAAGPAELHNVVTSPDDRAICEPDLSCVTTHLVPAQPPLATTGGAISWSLAAAAAALLIGGAVLLAARRRREVLAIED